MSTCKLVFRGDIAPGHNFTVVRQRLKEMFRLDDEGINKIFCGRPVTIKKDLDKPTAEKWKNVLLQAGATVEIVSDSGLAETAPDPVAAEQGPGGNWLVEPPGADVLKPNERQEFEPVNVNTDDLSIDSVGADVLRPEERREFVELDLDLSHLSVSDPGG